MRHHVDAADCLLPGQPAANPTTLKLAVDACLDAVPSGEKCCSTDPGCDDPATARCRGAGCVDLPDWDVSRVTDMTELFEDRTEFNQDISRWNTSSVTSFKETFRNASSFDQDLSRWGLSPGVDFTSDILRRRRVRAAGVDVAARELDWYVFRRFCRSIG